MAKTVRTDPPVIIDPFSYFGDEIAGSTPEEVAQNLIIGTRIALKWRAGANRPCPDLRELFRGCVLSSESKMGLVWVTGVYAKQQKT